MSTPPLQSTSAGTGSRAFGWCAWHSAMAEGVRLINVIEQGSGPGGTQFACAPCRDLYGLTPFADGR